MFKKPEDISPLPSGMMNAFNKTIDQQMRNYDSPTQEQASAPEAEASIPEQDLEEDAKSLTAVRDHGQGKSQYKADNEKSTKERTKEVEALVSEGTLKVTNYSGSDAGGQSPKSQGIKVKKVASGRYGDDVEMTGPDAKLIAFAIANLGVDKSAKTIADAQKQINESKKIASEDDDKELDKVDPKAAKKKFDDREDKDIDNDGDEDDSDEYLHKRRQAIAKALAKKKVEESVELDEEALQFDEDVDSLEYLDLDEEALDEILGTIKKKLGNVGSAIKKKLGAPEDPREASGYQKAFRLYRKYYHARKDANSAADSGQAMGREQQASRILDDIKALKKSYKLSTIKRASADVHKDFQSANPSQAGSGAKFRNNVKYKESFDESDQLDEYVGGIGKKIKSKIQQKIGGFSKKVDTGSYRSDKTRVKTNDDRRIDDSKERSSYNRLVALHTKVNTMISNDAKTTSSRAVQRTKDGEKVKQPKNDNFENKAFQQRVKSVRDQIKSLEGDVKTTTARAASKAASAKKQNRTESVNEAKENSYTVVHAKKGKVVVTAPTSYAAAQKAAKQWKLKSTAGVDSYLMEGTSVKKTEREALDEGKMKEFHDFMQKGKSPEFIAKKMGLDLKTVKQLMDHLDESVELDEALKTTHVVIDTADGNKIVSSATNEKQAKSSIVSAERPPLSIKDKKTLKVVQLKKPVSLNKDILGTTLKEEAVQLDEVRGKLNAKGEIEMTKANFAKVHKDFKTKIKGQPFAMQIDPKSGGSALFPVKFIKEEVALDEAYQVYVKSQTAKSGWIAQGQPHKTEADAKKDAKSFGGVTKIVKEEVALDEAYQQFTDKTPNWGEDRALTYGRKKGYKEVAVMGNSKLNSMVLFALNSSDKQYVKGANVKSGETIFRYSTRISIAGDIFPLVKVNIAKGIFYSLTQESSEGTIETAKFETKGVKLKFFRSLEGVKLESIEEAKMKEGNTFTKALAAARLNGDDEFIVSGKKYSVAEHAEELDEAVDSADMDDMKATKGDKESAKMNIIVQLRKAADVKGNLDIVFANGKKQKLPANIIKIALDKFNSFRKPVTKEKLVTAMSKSYKDMLVALKTIKEYSE